MLGTIFKSFICLSTRRLLHIIKVEGKIVNVSFGEVEALNLMPLQENAVDDELDVVEIE